MATNRNWFKRLFRLDFDDQFDAALDLIEVQEIAIVDVHDRVDGVQEAVKVVTGRVDTVEGKLAALKTFDFFGRTVVAQFDFEKSIVGDTSITVSIDNVAAQAFLRFGSARVVDTIDAVWFISKTGVPIQNDFGDVLHPAAQRRDVQKFLYMTSEKQGDEPLDIIIPDHTHDNYISIDELNEVKDALDLKFDKAGGDLSSGGAFIGTNRLKPQGSGTNTLYEGSSYNHPQALINSAMMKEYAAEKDHEHDVVEVPPPVYVGDDEPKDPEEGDLWYDTNRLEMFIYYDGGWITTNALGARIEAGEEIQRELQARVAAGEAEQEILQAKVNALEGSTGTHPYILSDKGNPREGQVTPSTSASQVTTNVHEVGYLAFNLKDANGRDVDADRAQGDDMIRFTDQHGNIVEYQINGEGYEGFFLIAGLLRSEFDTFVVGQKYDVSWHSRFDPSGLATIKYVDQRDATKISLSGENSVDTSWRLKNGNATIFSTSTAGKVKIYNLEAPTNWSHAANKDYVDDHVAPTWHWKQNGANSYAGKCLYWFDASDTTRQFSVAGVPMLGRTIELINGLNSADGAPRELMTISGKKNGKQVFVAIAPVRSWTMTSSIVLLRVNKADMLHWDPEALDNDAPVTVKFGGLF